MVLPTESQPPLKSDQGWMSHARGVEPGRELWRLLHAVLQIDLVRGRQTARRRGAFGQSLHAQLAGACRTRPCHRQSGRGGGGGRLSLRTVPMVQLITLQPAPEKEASPTAEAQHAAGPVDETFLGSVPQCRFQSPNLQLTQAGTGIRPKRSDVSPDEPCSSKERA
jgi:hypothetical protein